jgi:hypothetical protein
LCTQVKRGGMEKCDYLLRSLRDWLDGLGYDESQVHPRLGHLKPDLVVQRGNDLLLVEAKVANLYRSQVFPALVGDIILRAKASAGEGSGILIALLIKRMSDMAVNDLRSYAQDFLPELNWFLMDEAGNGVARIHGQDSALSLSPLQVDDSSGKAAAPQPSLFSLNNQWLLKMLLLPGIDPKYWGGAEEIPSSIVGLAKAARVPQPSVSSFISRFEQAEYIRREKGALVVVRHRELLDEWFYACKGSQAERVPVKSMYGDDPERFLRRIRDQSRNPDSPDMIVSYHLACHLRGVGRSNVRVGWAYSCRSLEIIMRDYDLVEDKSPSPSFWIVPGKAMAVKRGAVDVGGIPVCDILQCYLDVRESHARGQEQADYILNEILMPHFEGMV